MGNGELGIGNRELGMGNWLMSQVNCKVRRYEKVDFCLGWSMIATHPTTSLFLLPEFPPIPPLGGG